MVDAVLMVFEVKKGLNAEPLKLTKYLDEV